MIKRSITTIAILAFIIPVIIFGDYKFGGLPGEIFFLSSIVILTCYAAYELSSFLFSDELRKTTAISVASAVIVNTTIITFFALMLHETDVLGEQIQLSQIDPMWFLAFLPLVLIPFSFFVIEDNEKRFIYCFVMFAYTAWAFSMLFINFVWGVRSLAWPMLIPILMDTFAYFIGSMFGRHKIAPNTSPNKTWEGTIGGLSVATTIGAIWALLVVVDKDQVTTGIAMFALGSVILIGIIAFLGDLAFSKMKRMIGKKDFGSILPGHGGLFDRIDGHLFTVPTSLISLVIILEVFL